MTTTIRVKTTNFKLLQPETAASLCSVFNQIDEMRRKRSKDIGLTEMHFRDASTVPTGGVTITAGVGVTINPVSGRVNRTAYPGGVLFLKNVGTNSWDIGGLQAIRTEAVKKSVLCLYQKLRKRGFAADLALSLARLTVAVQRQGRKKRRKLKKWRVADPIPRDEEVGRSDL